MTHNHDPTPSLPAPVRWASLGVVVFALLGLILAGSRLVRAGASAEISASHPAVQSAPSGVTNTVLLPLVQRNYPCIPLGDVSITGPVLGTVGEEYVFTAAISPSKARQPVTYTWQATGQAPVVHSAGLSDTVAFTWEVIGTKAITVEASNECGVAVSNTTSISLPWDSRGLIAFERLAEGGEFHDIFLMYNDGSGLENLTDYPADDGAPTWSPDGNYIAFASTRVENDENRAIYKIDLRTREVTQLTDGTYDDRWPAWSPTGDQIAFMRNLGQNEIFVMDTEGGDQTQLTFWDWGDEFPAWSPDGGQIVFSSERFWLKRDLWIMDADGENLHIVLQTDRDGDDLNDEIYPTWAPDGRIYYTFKISKNDQSLYRIWPDGSGQGKVFNDDYNRWIASWAPDGQCLVFYSYMGGADKEVWKWCQGFSDPINLTNNDGISDEFCAWSPVP